uniref:Tail protein n=1 Tax=viral metagenome TaxID=1070528 RepID=A0A6H1ZE51_9ZZZZ
MATTPTAIIAGLITAIEALTPKGGTSAGIESAYKHTADDMPEGAEETWADRQFRITTFLPRAVDTVYGRVAIVDYEALVEIEISHVIGPWQASVKRMSEDVHQLIDQLQRLGCFTAFAGVSQIRLTETDQSITTEEDFWTTRLRFRVNYALAANYGG